MLFIDETSTLQELFEKLRADTPAAAALTAGAPSPLPAEEPPHPLMEAVGVTSDAQSAAAATAQRRIKETMALIDSTASFSVSRLESQLLLCEAELMSVSGAAAELQTSIEAARGECGRKRSPGGPPTTTVGLTPQLLDHLQEALSIVRRRNTHWRERVGLCKEELARYRNEMFLFARCNVLSCTMADIAVAQASGGSSSARNTEETTVAAKTVRHRDLESIVRHPAQGDDDAPALRPGFGLISGVARNFMQLDSAVKGAVPTSLSSLNINIEHMFASGASTLLGHKAPSSGGGGVLSLRGDAPQLPALPLAPRFRYSPAEEERLQEQSLALVQRQHEQSAQDAKAIEASVRELSQLTSLMNEKVHEQSENFSILVKNTTEAKVNYEKATGQLHRTEKTGSWLNATRQLIAALWVSTALIIVANYLIG